MVAHTLDWSKGIDAGPAVVAEPDELAVALHGGQLSDRAARCGACVRLTRFGPHRSGMPASRSAWRSFLASKWANGWVWRSLPSGS